MSVRNEVNKEANEYEISTKALNEQIRDLFIKNYKQGLRIKELEEKLRYYEDVKKSNDKVVIFSFIKHIFNSNGFITDDISLNTSFENDLGIDSLDVFMIIMAVEEEYKINFDNVDYFSLKTIDDLVNTIIELRGN